MANHVHEPEPAPHESVPFWPHHILKEAATIPLLVALLVAIVLLVPPHTGEPADPYSTPSHIKPEWYFLAAYQTLKIVPSEVLGLIVQGAAFFVLLCLPFLDRSPRTALRNRPVFALGVALAILAVVGLSIWGHYS